MSFAAASPPAATALTERQQRVIDRHLTGLVAGEPEMCVNASRLGSSGQTIIVSDRVLLFRVSSSLVYRNNMQQECPGMERSPYEPNIHNRGSSICRGDTVTSEEGSCNLGDFVPFHRAPQPAA